MPTILERITNRIFSRTVDRLMQRRLATISTRVDDSAGWNSLSAAPADRPWSDVAQDLDDALEAWRLSFLARRITTLAHSYVVGNGITISSRDPQVDAFIRAFWDHPKNHLDTRLAPMCDELTRAGELFPVLHTNRIDGMSYVRFVPARQIHSIRTADNDYETELEYTELAASGTRGGPLAPRTWIGPDHPRAFRPTPQLRKLPPLMLHFAVNRPIGATRGESDLGPVLPWIKRYTEWLKDRVRLNRQRTRQGILDVILADDSLVEDKKHQLITDNPVEAGIYVHGPGETTETKPLNIQAGDAADDGRTLRLAIATGANLGLHYLGEGESINYATAKEMGEPTTRFYSERQEEFTGFLCALVTAAYRRRCATYAQPWPDDLQLVVSVTEIARADNQALATATKDVTAALVQMFSQDWIDDDTALRLALKFAGETADQDEIARILTAAASNKHREPVNPANPVNPVPSSKDTDK
ncbi:MAG: hypothetical protein JXM73_14215 [Anaerolineae bacterium]|nr:hypothetical protein [Anaerolineae bacterium]